MLVLHTSEGILVNAQIPIFDIVVSKWFWACATCMAPKNRRPQILLIHTKILKYLEIGVAEDTDMKQRGSSNIISA